MLMQSSSPQLQKITKLHVGYGDQAARTALPARILAGLFRHRASILHGPDYRVGRVCCRPLVADAFEQARTAEARTAEEHLRHRGKSQAPREISENPDNKLQLIWRSFFQARGRSDWRGASIWPSNRRQGIRDSLGRGDARHTRNASVGIQPSVDRQPVPCARRCRKCRHSVWLQQEIKPVLAGSKRVLRAQGRQGLENANLCHKRSGRQQPGLGRRPVGRLCLLICPILHEATFV